MLDQSTLATGSTPDFCNFTPVDFEDEIFVLSQNASIRRIEGKVAAAILAPLKCTLCSSSFANRHLGC